MVLDPLSKSSFTQVVHGLMPTVPMALELYADANRNCKYDDPPTDHSWLRLLPVSSGDTTFSFSYDNGFTRLDWTSALTIYFHNMTPHLGELFEMRIIDTAIDSVVYEMSKNPVETAEFTVTAPVVQDGESYRIDFYADHNKNGMYDPPPADHAWRVELDNASGDQFINFTHNLDFTDIGFPSSVSTTENVLLQHLELKANYPNPFNPSTVIPFTMSRAANVELMVYNLQGERIAVLVKGRLSAGTHSVVWSGAGLPSGLYLARLSSGTATVTRPMVFLK